MSDLRANWREHSAELGRAIRPDAVLLPAVPEARAVATVERRDPTAATTLTKYQAPGQVQVPEWDAETAIRNAYLIDVVVARCTQIIAETVASVPFVAGADPAKPADRNPNSPLAKLLGPAPGGPAPKLASQVWWRWNVAQRIVTGRWGSEIETDNTGTPIALWPLASAYLKAVPTAGGAEWWAGFTYGNGRAPRKLPADRVLYGWDPSLLDFREPYSVLQSARLAVSVAVMAARYNYSFLRNDARPASVMVTEEFESDDEYRKFKSQMRGEYGGPDNAGKMHFLEADPDRTKPSEALNVFTLGLSQRDARLIEQEKAALEHVAIAMGVPWSKLDASGRTFDNASQEDQSWWESRILPLLTTFADEVNNQLAPRLGSDVGWFDLSNVRALKPARIFTSLATDAVPLLDRRVVVPNEVRADVGLPPMEGGDVPLEQQSTARVGAPALLQAKIATLNEARALVGLEAVPDGDRFLTDEEVAALKGGAPMAALSAPAGDQRTVEPVSQEPEPPSPLLTFDEVRTWEPLEDRGPSPEDIEARRARIWRATDAALTALEARWAKSMRRLFERQRKAVLSRLEGNRGRRVIEQRANAGELFDPEHWLAETIDDVTALYELVGTAAFTRMADAFGIAFDIEAPYAQDFIRARAKQLAGQVTDTTYEAIQEALAAGVAEGEGIPDLAKRITHVFEVASDARATVIARTEVISAYGGSTRLAGNEMPDDVLGGFEWIATRDGRTREEHAAADGQTIHRDAAFDIGGELLAYPGDPAGSPENTIQCRCALASLSPAEMTDRARPVLEQRVTASTAAAVLAMTPEGPFDELGLRRALREAAA